MKISPISCYYNSYPSQKVSNKTVSTQKNNISKKNDIPSFKSIYVEDLIDLGEVSEKKGKPLFLPKDYYLLNEIANQYPYQDCFIMCGKSNYPRLEYRERPPQVQVFSRTLANEYKVELDPYESDYPIVPLLIHDDDDLNRFIGMTSYISLNPSLPTTVQAGYELHKKMIEKKYEILELIGKTDDGGFDIGEDTVMERAYKEIEDLEIAVTRYLLESAFAALSDRASAKQLYESNYPKVQSRIALKRKIDLTTSKAKQPVMSPEELNSKQLDICEYAMRNFPNTDENKKRIEVLKKYMSENNLSLG